MTAMNPIVNAANTATMTAMTPAQQAANLWCRLIAADNRAAIQEARVLVSAGRTRGYVSGFLWGKEDFSEMEMRLFLVGCFTCYFQEILYPKIAETQAKAFVSAIETRVKELVGGVKLEQLTAISKELKNLLA